MIDASIQIQTLASGSRGNCYLLTDNKAPLLIEAGLPVSRIKKALDYKLHQVKGCLVSHEHKDHAHAVKDLLRAGVDCYMSQGTAEALACASHHRVHTVSPDAVFSVGPWNVLPVPAHHDAAEPLCFVIARTDQPFRLLFATDTAGIPYKIKNLTHLMIECNFDPYLVWESIMDGELDRKQARHILENHMGLDQLETYMRLLDKRHLKEVHLIHASGRNLDPVKALDKIRSTTCVEVHLHGDL